MMRKLTFWLLAGLLSIPALSNAQTDYKFHTVFMYNFTKYVKWPDNSIQDKFVIGVVGKAEIISHLEQMAATKNVNGKPIEVRVFNSAAEVNNCHMVFIPRENSSDLSSLRSHLAKKPTLIVSEKEGLAKAGSDINFIIDNGRWKFEMNEAATAMHDLKVSAELSKFASKIYSEI